MAIQNTKRMSVLPILYNTLRKKKEHFSKKKHSSRKFISNIWRLLLISFKEDKILFISYFSTAALGASLLFGVYFLYKLMIDQVAHNAGVIPGNSLFIIIGTYLFFEYLSRFVNFTFNQYYFDYFVKAKLQDALTRLFMKKLGDMDFTNLEKGEVRNLIAKVENNYTVRLPEILHTLNAIVYNIAALVFSLLIALKFSPIYFVMLAVICTPVYYLRAKYGNIAWSAQTKNASGANYVWYLKSLFTNFQTLSEMKIYGLGDHFIQKTEELQKKMVADYQKPIALYSLLSTVSFILIPIAIYFALTHFISGVDTKAYSIGDFTFFLNILFTFSGQISSILINIGAVSENSLYLEDYFNLLDIKNTTFIPDNPKYFDTIGPRQIIFDNVSFKYPGAEAYSLKNINLVIEKGQDTAIVGHNGAGKSTLIKLLFRFYDPTDGRILVDGVDLKHIDIEHWYQHIGVLFQDFAKYYLSLEENIWFGNLEKLKGMESREQKREEVENALKHSHSEDLLRFLPKGYQQVLGRWFDSGVELSGGQWQKVAIARAIFRDAPILIVDEPTSAIDPDGEVKIFDKLKELYKTKNLLFISHRFSNVRMAHKIYVLEKGELIEQGSHQELLDKYGLYAQFFQLQKRGYE